MTVKHALKRVNVQKADISKQTFSCYFIKTKKKYMPFEPAGTPSRKPRFRLQRTLKIKNKKEFPKFARSIR
jgi:hypothetical protein